MDNLYALLNEIRGRALVIWETFAGLEMKDKLLIAGAAIAVVLAIYAVLLSSIAFKRRERGSRTALRAQLADVMQRLLEVETEGAKRAPEPEVFPKDHRSVIEVQRHFYARRALTLIDQFDDKDVRWELLLTAQTFAALTDLDTAEQLFSRALAIKGAPLDDAAVLRGHSHFLFKSGQIKEARKTIERALERLADGKIHAHERGLILEQWAVDEWWLGDRQTVSQLLHRAREEYISDAWMKRNVANVERLDNLKLRSEADRVAKVGTA